MEDYWLRYGFKENGEIICTRVISKVKPSKVFFYTEGNMNKEVENTVVVKLTPESIRCLGQKN
ncbi:MAG: hypothetical protein KKF44_08480 [Nanoarchaeota archaeon]|nr:hypothetical protein [Nanoarchaeota archaeon]